MSTALTKRLTISLQEWTRRAEALSPLPARLPVEIIAPRRSSAIAAPGEVIWLLRICALVGEGWVHSYIADGCGGYRPGEGLRMPESRWKQFKRSANIGAFDVGDSSQEECPWCGSTYRHWGGPVHCNRCNAFVCMGRTTDDDYFYCRPACGSHGQLHIQEREDIGFVPNLQRGDFPGR